MEAGSFEWPSEGTQNWGGGVSCHTTQRSTWWSTAAWMLEENNGRGPLFNVFWAGSDVTSSVLSALTFQRSQLGTGALCSHRLPSRSTGQPVGASGTRQTYQN